MRDRAALHTATAVAVLALMAAAACSPPPPAPGRQAAPATGSTPAASTAPAVPPRTISPTYTPSINPADFSSTIDNPYFPLVPGTRFVYEGTTPDGHERNITDVTRDTKTIMGVETRVVHDVVSVDGRPEEETFDWYAQDKQGNVWYFGEDTKKLGGPTVDTAGSFVAGVNGALPGIIMPGNPAVGDAYRQEYAKGHAEDTAKILSLAGTEMVPFGGAYTGLLVTEDVNPLNPTAAVENKYFARGVGFLVVVHVTGPPERVQLIAVERF